MRQELPLEAPKANGAVVDLHPPKVARTDQPPVNPPVIPEPAEPEFDWSSDNPVVIIPGQPTTAVYTNPFDAIVIRQECTDFSGDCDDPTVFISRANLAAFINRLSQFLPKG